jgi:hypothetical protein
VADQKLTLKILGDGKSAISALKQTSAAVKETGAETKASSGIGAAGGAMLAAAFVTLSAAAVKFGMDSFKAFAKSEVSQKRLASVVNNTGVSYDNMKASINKTLTAEANLSSIGKGELRDALTKLTMATQDVNAAQSLIPVTADLAIAAQLDTAAAAKLVGKAWNGNSTALKKLGIEIPSGLKGMEAINALQEQVAGSAADYGTTAEASVRRANNAWGGLKVTIGEKVAPTVVTASNLITGTLTNNWAAADAETAKYYTHLYGWVSQDQAQTDWRYKLFTANEKAAIAQEILNQKTTKGASTSKTYAGALADVTQALKDQKDEERNATQAGIDYDRAVLAKKDAVVAEKKAHQDARKAQADYTKAVHDHGAKSKQAADAGKKLADANENAQKAAIDARQSTLDLSKAEEAAGKTASTAKGRIDPLIGTYHGLAAAAREAADRVAAANAQVSKSNNGGLLSTPVSQRHATGGLNPGVPQLTWWGEDGAERIVPLSAKYRDEGLANWTAAGHELGVLGSGGGRPSIVQNFNGSAFDADVMAVAAQAAVLGVFADAG